MTVVMSGSDRCVSFGYEKEEERDIRGMWKSEEAVEEERRSKRRVWENRRKEVITARRKGNQGSWVM